VVDAYRLFQEW